MRTFPRALAEFRRMAKSRGDSLRQLSKTELLKLKGPIEHVTLDGRSGTFATIVEECAEGSLRVVVQGFLQARWFPGKHVALDGFYKHENGTVSPMPDNEFHDFD